MGVAGLNPAPRNLAHSGGGCRHYGIKPDQLSAQRIQSLGGSVVMGLGIGRMQRQAPGIGAGIPVHPELTEERARMGLDLGRQKGVERDLRSFPWLDHPHQPQQRPEQHVLEPDRCKGLDERRADPAGMDADGRDAAALKAPGQMPGVQQVGQLGLGIGRPAIVGTPREVRVLEVDAAGPTLGHVVVATGDIDDARRSSGTDARQQLLGQQEMSEVVGAELGLETLPGAPHRRIHDAGVVDEPMDLGVTLANPGGKVANTFEAGEVQCSDLDGTPLALGQQFGTHPLTLCRPATGEDDVRPLPCQLRDRNPADTGVASRDDIDATGQVGLQERFRTHQGLWHDAMKPPSTRWPPTRSMVSPMHDPDAIVTLQARLQAARTDRSHAFWNRYMKGVLPYRGVAMGDIRRAVHDWWRNEGQCPDPLPVALALLGQTYGEDKVAGILLLDEIAGEKVVAGHLPALAKVFDCGHVADWSTCDWLCLKVLGKIAERALPDPGPSQTLSSWVDAPGPWRIRAALVSFIKLAARGEQNFPGFTAQMLDTCAMALARRDRFIHTGVGWLLRELAKADSVPVLSFLNEHGNRLTREGLRYATEAMAPLLRDALLNRARG